MLEAIVYGYLLRHRGEKVTYSELVVYLKSKLTDEDLDHKGQLKRWKAIKIIGGMIANRDITIMDDGSVKIA